MKKEFKVGDKVRIIEGLHCYSIHSDFMQKYMNADTKAWNYNNKIENKLTDKEGVINAIGKHEKTDRDLAIVNIDNYSVIMDYSGLESLEINTKKTNKIERINDSNKTIIEYDIENNYITFKVEGKLHMSPLLKILLHETELYNFTYERISPYKVERVWDSKKQVHRINLDFIDVKDNYEQKTKVLIETNHTLALENSTHKIFIPDFLELCVERNILTRDDKGYKLIKNLEGEMKYCKYLQSKPSKHFLTKQGFIIPSNY